MDILKTMLTGGRLTNILPGVSFIFYRSALIQDRLGELYTHPPSIGSQLMERVAVGPL
ncbi:MAG: hypothetical protein MI755_16200 [Sphingomonadales bacterium]|nr:hypothetical protein [Sphingomonadales bacterium]